MDTHTTIKAAVSPAGWLARGQAGSRRAHQLAVGLLTAAMAAGYSVFSLFRNYTFHTASYDLVIFDQAVRSYAHFQPGISVVKGIHNGFGPHFSVLGDHWSPILAVLAPLYWIDGSPQTLLVAQAVLFALAIPPLWLFTRRAFGGGPTATAAAYLVAAAYALSWPIASAANFAFHEVAFAPVLSAVALERLQAGRLRTALIALAALLMVKEDMGLLVAGIGLALAVARPATVPRQRLVALALIVVGVFDTWLTSQVLIPAFGGRADYYWAYGALGSNLHQAAWHVLSHPLSALRLLVTPQVKLTTMLWLFGAFCFLPLRSPLALAAVPPLLERMLGSKFPNWWTVPYQYNAYLVIVLACAAVDGAARLDGSVRRLTERLRGARDKAAAVIPGSGPVALAGAVAIFLVALVLVPRFALGHAFRPSFYQRSASMRAAAAAVAVVPSGVTVEAMNKLGPQLSGRDTVLIWDARHLEWAPWVVASVTRHEFTFTSLAQQRGRVALLRRSGYRVVFRREGYLVLHRTGARPGAGLPAGGAG